MTTRKTISAGAAVLGLTLMAASATGAQNSTGSTDVYKNDFPKSFTIDRTFEQQSRAPVAGGSPDFWSTDFHKAFTTVGPVRMTQDMSGKTGSTDIWNTDFQKAFM